MCITDTEANPSHSFSSVIDMYGDTDNVVQVTIWDTLYLLGCLSSKHTQ